MFSGCFDRARLHGFLARSEIQTDLSFCFVYMRCFSQYGLNFQFRFGGGRSTLAGQMFTTDFKNKNPSRPQKTLEKAVPVMFFEFCYSQPDKKCYDHPELKILLVRWF